MPHFTHTAENGLHIATLTAKTRIIGYYVQQPEPCGLHAKLLREHRAASPFTIESTGGPPNTVRVRDDATWVYVWLGHRDGLPQRFRNANDPSGLLTRPASD